MSCQALLRDAKTNMKTTNDSIPAERDRAFQRSARHLDPSTWSYGILGRRGSRPFLVGLLLILDAAMVIYAMLLAYLMYQGWPSSMGQVDWTLWSLPIKVLRTARSPEFGPFVPLLAVAPFISVAIFGALRLYKVHPTNLRPFSCVGPMGRGAVFVSFMLAVISYMLHEGQSASRWPPMFWVYLIYAGAIIFIGGTLAHSAVLIAVLGLQTMGAGRVRVATVAGPETVKELADRLSSPASLYEYMGNIDIPDGDRTVAAPFSLGQVNELRMLINRHDLNEIILSREAGELTTDQRLMVAQTCWQMGTELKMVPPFHPFFRTAGEPELLGDVPLLRVERAGLYATWPQILKRTMDLSLSLLGLTLLAPFMLAAAIAIKLDSPGPVFFRQERVGLNGRVFRMWKFRSMYTNADSVQHQEYLKRLIRNGEAHSVDAEGKPVFKIAHDPRITRVGRFMRRTSIDELPQLFNVFSGDMSLVGPRPPLEYEVNEYRDWHMERLNIRPGITGLWQVSGRSRLSFDQMVELDIAYIERWSLLLDLTILIRTIPVVLKIGHAY